MKGMKSFITRIRQSLRRQPRPDPQRYAAERALVLSQSEADRLVLAQDPKTHPEILYYLAVHDPAFEVRQAVLGNASLPVQVAQTVAHDPHEDVRMVLADRLCRLLPDVSETQHAQIYAYITQALGTQALDEVLKVRVALSSAIQHVANAPPKLVATLARDIERSVSEPILRSCVALPDAEIIDILRNCPAPWVTQAIAARPKVSVMIARAVIDQGDEKAGVLLLENKGANLTRPVLQAIVDKAKDFPSWHKPLALQKSLPASLALALAAIIDLSVREVLLGRNDFDAATVNEIAAVTRRRVAMMDVLEAHDTAQDRFKALLKARNINENTLLDALGLRDKELAFLLLAHIAGTSTEQVQKILQMRAPKPILALCWKAGLPMRIAFVVEKDLAGLSGADLLLPKGGTDYPLSEKDLQWQVEFLDL